MRVALISPRHSVQKGDFLGSGVPYWPIELATLAAVLREADDEPVMIDQFGANPGKLIDAGDHYLQGEPIGSRVFSEALQSAQAFVLYAISYMSHAELLATCRWLRARYPRTSIAVLENTQAVTGYSLATMSRAFAGGGVDLLICGEPHFDCRAIRSLLSPGDRDGLEASGPRPDNKRSPN